MEDLFNQDLSQLPSFLPGETLYNWCGRYHQLTGYAHATTTSNQLFTSRFSGLSHDFPNHIDTFTRRTGNHLGTNDSIVLERTLYPFYLPFIDSARSEKITRGALLGTKTHTKYLLGLPASRLGANHPLKGCETCWETDKEKYGIAYWRLNHQLPSTWICRKHHEPLITIITKKTPVHYRDWILPNSGPCRDFISLPTLSKIQINILETLAELGEQVLKQPSSVFLTTTLSQTYQFALYENGMLTDGGNVRLNSLLIAIENHYKDFKGIPGFEVLESLKTTMGGFIGAITRLKSKPSHPFKHLLLIAFLFHDWNTFITTYQLANSQHPQWFLPISPIITKKENPSKYKLKNLVVKKHLSIREAAKKLGVSVTTAVVWAQLLGIQFTKRPKLLNEKMLSRIRELLRKGTNKIEICKSTGASIVSLNRILRCEHELAKNYRSSLFSIKRKEFRANFSDLIKNNPGKPVKFIRLIPGNGYQWLYRHDRIWLRDNLPFFNDPHINQYK